jgi:GNAT superfamily N-acetyltransferase
MRAEVVPGLDQVRHMAKANGTTVELARPDEAQALTSVQTATFDDDTQRHLGKPRGGPFGYDSLEFCEALIAEGRMYAIKEDGAIIGGAFVTERDEGTITINRLFIAPGQQGKGIGRRALLALEARFPKATSFVLDTPIWAERNQHFYESLGYRRVGESLEKEHGFMLIIYEKRRGGRI